MMQTCKSTEQYQSVRFEQNVGKIKRQLKVAKQKAKKADKIIAEQLQLIHSLNQAIISEGNSGVKLAYSRPRRVAGVASPAPNSNKLKSDSTFIELVSQDKVVASQDTFNMTVASNSKLPVNMEIGSMQDIGQSQKVTKTTKKAKLSHRPQSTSNIASSRSNLPELVAASPMRRRVVIKKQQ